MIRTKAKGILLSIALVLVCFCFVACKETKVKVEDIAFTEQSISLLVGEEYEPQVKILPSYANDRSYTLIAEDVTALHIEGGTITALKPAMGVKLKVVSNENDNINDIITVDIYAEAAELDAPTNLTFDGHKFGFVNESSANASSYVLKIDGREIDIGNNVEYSFDNAVAKLGDLTNRVMTCEVKAVGDGKIFKDSPYSEKITFVKLSKVDNIYIEDEILYFDAIEDVAGYDIRVMDDGELVATEYVANPSFEACQLSFDLIELTDNQLGAELTFEIEPRVIGYNYNGEINVSTSGSGRVDYVVIGAVQNIAINDRFISWDFVKNAESYTLELYRNGSRLNKYENITTNYLNMEYEDAGQYYCVVLANSSKPNTTTGQIYSDRLNFSILPAPIVEMANNTISWSGVASAEGYLVSVKNADGTMLVNKKFVLETTYNVSSFDAGRYGIEVVACGNGQDVLSSKVSAEADWTVLNKTQFRIADKKLYWVDTDESTLNKYALKFSTSASNEIDLVLTNANYDAAYYYDEAENTFVYDLAGYDFEPNTYTISLQSLGSGNVFDAEANTIDIIKLAEGSITGLQNKVITAAAVESATRYAISLYNAADGEFASPITTIDAVGGGTTFDLDDSLLGAGNYVAKVLVYGNGTNILDADNGANGTLLTFRKLATPTISLDSANLKLTIGDVDYASGYSLFENSTNKNIVGQEYDLSTLSAGDYLYTVQAMGDSGTILDSAITVAESAIRVKKLATPTLTFDKVALTYDVACADEEYVGNYTFTLNDVNFLVVNNQANCAAQMSEAIEYVAKVHANPVAAAPGYNLVIASEAAQHESVRLAGECGFEIAGGKLLVTPVEPLTGTGYSLQVRIENGASDIMLTEFTYLNARFEIALYAAENYEIINEAINALVEAPSQYSIYCTISQDDGDVIDSNETEMTSKLTVLSRVANIGKNLQTIEFDNIDGATSYVLLIEVNGQPTYIDLSEQYTTSGSKNVLEMATLIELMEVYGVEYLEQTQYAISFVAVSSDTSVLCNKGVESYNFEFLPAPTISLTEKEGAHIKQVSIENLDANTAMYGVYITQGQTEYDANYIKSSTETTFVELDGLTRFVAGEVEINVKAIAASGDYFESKYSKLSAIKLDSAEISIVDGILQWAQIENAKQYNLVYTKDGGLHTVELYDGAENFTIGEGMCSYNFDLLSSGLTDLYLQVDSELEAGGTYYLNSNNGKTFANVYKLPTLAISVVNGEIYTEITNMDLALVERVELLVDERPIEVDITQEHEHIKLDLGADKLAITINPVLLLQYGVDSLLLETISIKLYSNNDTTLNSSTATKGVYGLLEPRNLNITTSTTTIKEGVINEVLEKITWNNPRANASHVVRYEIVITYNEQDYIFTSQETAFMMPTFWDENNNSEFDEGELEFGAGEYAIKVRAITDNCENIANSRFCEEIMVTVLATPTQLSTQEGNVIWSNDINVEYYLIKVYLLNNDDGEVEESLLVSSEGKVNQFDLCNLPPFETGVYGITVQAMHNHARILASKESKMLQVIRLPQVTSYFVDDGELYINAHSFFTKAEIYFMDNKPTPTKYTFVIDNEDVEPYDEYINEIKDWATSSVLDTYSDENYFVKAKYVGEDNDATFRTALAQTYSVQIKLCGNTASNYSIISGHASTAVNARLPLVDGVGQNVVDKLVTPTIVVSETQRGMLLFNIPDGLNYETLSYYQDGEKALRGVHLYTINISSDKVYTINIAEIFDQSLFEASLNAVDRKLIKDGEDKHYLQHFEYNDITFNVIDKNDDGYIPFNFNTNYYYYYAIDGTYSTIELNNGGSFVASVRFLGDDTRFVKSNISEPATIKRYNVLNLAIKDGAMSWINQATADDHPIYLVTLTSLTENYNIVLYNPTVYPDVEMLKGCLDSNKTYLFDTITYSIEEGVEDQYITYAGLADIVNAARLANGSKQVGEGGVFLASVQAHYTDGTATDIILAQGVESKTITVLPETQLTSNNGVLTWDLSHISENGGTEYIYYYLLQVFDEADNKLYEIRLNAADYSVVNHVATYQLPRMLQSGEDAGFEFMAEGRYKFKLVALAGDSTTYVNSIATVTSTLNILPDLQDVRMENGVLTWTNPTTSRVEIYITYTIDGALVEYVAYENGTRFELPESFTDLSGTARRFIAGYDYTIKVRLRGTNTTLNGFFSEEITTQRLATIIKDVNTSDGKLDISTNNGVLTWNAVELPELPEIPEQIDDTGAIGGEGDIVDTPSVVTYTIKYTLEDLTTGQIDGIEINEYDLEGLPAGIIWVQIIANHNNYFSSFASESVQLFKLTPPTNIKFNAGTTTISWDKAFDNQGNKIDHYRVIVKEDGKEPFEEDCATSEWVISGVTSANFEIAVKTVCIAENGELINSDYTEYHSMVQPSAVDVETFVFDSELQAFKWKAIEGENAGDKYYISYNYFEPNSEIPTKVENVEITISRQLSDGKYYFYYPNAIGRYTLISVHVVRAGSLNSQPTYCMGGEVTYELNFDLFSSGDGISNPYIIINETQLRNIKYFLNAKYMLDVNITLTSSEPITTSEQVFKGTINGNNKYIYGPMVETKPTLSNTGYVGLFNKVAGATFVNIQLSGFNVGGYLGSSTLYMGVLVGYAEAETQFNNVVITSTVIDLTKNNQTGYASSTAQIYIGAIAGYAQNCQFTNCIINLGGDEPNIALYVRGNSSTRVSVGAVAGYANNCAITNTNVEGENNAFVIKYTLLAVESYIPVLKLGALVGTAGEEDVTISGNSCEYKVYTSQETTTHTNEIGNKN